MSGISFRGRRHTSHVPTYNREPNHDYGNETPKKSNALKHFYNTEFVNPMDSVSLNSTVKYGRKSSFSLQRIKEFTAETIDKIQSSVRNVNIPSLRMSELSNLEPAVVARFIGVIAVVITVITVVYEVFKGVSKLGALMLGMSGAMNHNVIGTRAIMYNSITKLVDIKQQGKSVMFEQEIHRSLQRFCIPYLGKNFGISALHKLEEETIELVDFVSNGGRFHGYSSIAIDDVGSLFDPKDAHTSLLKRKNSETCPFITALFSKGRSHEVLHNEQPGNKLLKDNIEEVVTKVAVTAEHIEESRKVLDTINHFYRSGECAGVGRALPKPAMRHLVEQTVAMVHSNSLVIDDSTRYVISDATGDLYTMALGHKLKGGGHYVECPNLATLLRELHPKTNKNIDIHIVKNLISEHDAFADAFEGGNHEVIDIQDLFDDDFQNGDNDESVVITSASEVETLDAIREFFENGVCNGISEHLTYPSKKHLVAQTLALVHSEALDLTDKDIRYIVSSDTGEVHLVRHDHELKGGAHYVECGKFVKILHKLHPKVQANKMNLVQIEELVREQMPEDGIDKFLSNSNTKPKKKKKSSKVNTNTAHGIVESVKRFFESGKCKGVGHALGPVSNKHLVSETLNLLRGDDLDLSDGDVRYIVGRDTGEIHMVYEDDELDGGEHYIECPQFVHILKQLHPKMKKKKGMTEDFLNKVVDKAMRGEKKHSHTSPTGAIHMVDTIVDFVKNGPCGGIWSSLSFKASKHLIGETVNMIYSNEIDVEDEELRYVIEENSGELHSIHDEDELEGGVEYIECVDFREILHKFYPVTERHLTQSELKTLISKRAKN